ncbi:MAG: Uma2 family endonuclease [Verrucomicrobiota bacterium]
MPAVALPARNQEQTERHYTLEEFLAGEFDEKVELVDGEIIPMGYTNIIHAALVSWLSHILRTWSDQHDWGLILSGDAGVLTKPATETRRDTARGADLICISFERYKSVAQKGKLIDCGPEVIIEVVSPSNTWNNINDKLVEYFDIGTNEIWVVSPDHLSIAVYATKKSSQSYSAEDSDVLTSQQLPGFELQLSQLADEVARLV